MLTNLGVVFHQTLDWEVLLLYPMASAAPSVYILVPAAGGGRDLGAFLYWNGQGLKSKPRA
jgi:hypothetical protein